MVPQSFLYEGCATVPGKAFLLYRDLNHGSSKSMPFAQGEVLDDFDRCENARILGP